MSVLSQFFGGGGGIGDSVPDTIKVIEFLLVGGGGGGGCSPSPIFGSGSGGGAGAMVEGTDFLVNNGETFSIVIGAGGAGGVGPSSDPGEPGSQSLFGSIFAGGGGSGGGTSSPNSGQRVRGTNGGSGGGGQGSYPSPTGSSSSGTGIGGVVGTGSLNYRYDVFNKHTQISTFASPGTNCGSPSAGPGGGAGGGEFGKSNSITGSPVTYAAGGSLPPPPVATSGTANTGNGGGGGGSGGGGSGGSGVCIIRWPTAYPDASSVTGNTPTPAQPGYYVYRWNGDGSITF